MPPSNLRRAHASAGLRAVVAVALAAACSVAAWRLSDRIDARARILPSPAERMVPEARSSLLALSHGSVEVVSTFSRRHPWHRAVHEALSAINVAAENIPGLDFSVEEVDPLRDIARMAELARTKELEPNLILLRRGEATRMLGEADLAVGDDSEAFAGVSPILEALVGLDRSEALPLYFTTGHGEFSPLDPNPVYGASRMGREFTRNGFETRECSLAEKDVPLDAAALVVLGPRTAFDVAEQKRINEYLQRGGRLFLLVDDATDARGLAPILADWDIRLAPAAADAAASISAIAVDAEHPATKLLRGIRLVWTNPWCAILPNTTDASMTLTTTLASLPLADGSAAAIAVAAERRSDESVRTHDARIVVWGNANLLSNSANVIPGNGRFAVACAQWLAGASAVSAPLPTDFTAPVDTSLLPLAESPRLPLLLCLAVPAAVLLFGILFVRPLARHL